MVCSKRGKKSPSKIEWRDGLQVSTPIKMNNIWIDVPSNLKEKFPVEAIFTIPKRMGKSNLYTVCITVGEEGPSFQGYLAVIEKYSKARWILR